MQRQPDIHMQRGLRTTFTTAEKKNTHLYTVYIYILYTIYSELRFQQRQTSAIRDGVQHFTMCGPYTIVPTVYVFNMSACVCQPFVCIFVFCLCTWT